MGAGNSYELPTPMIFPEVLFYYCDKRSPSAGGIGIFSPSTSVTNLYITIL